MALGVNHICEQEEAFRRAGLEHDPTPCRQSGTIFVRDAESYGHWVCQWHRSVFRRLSESAQGSGDEMTREQSFYVLLTRKRDRERFLYRFNDAAAAGNFQRRNRAPMPDGIPSPYGVSEIVFRAPEGRNDYAGGVR